MCSLRAIELVCVFIGARRGCVCGGIGDFSCFAVVACVERVPGVEDKGGGCGEEDVAVVWVDGYGCHCCGVCRGIGEERRLGKIWESGRRGEGR
jgi:hypothetical protein